MKIILDFDGLDGCLSVPAGIRNATEGAVAAPPGIASLKPSVAFAESESNTAIDAVTESVPIEGNTSQIALDDLEFTEPILKDSDGAQIESDGHGIAERAAAYDGENTQVDSDDLEITARVPLQLETFEDNHADALSPKEGPSPKPFFKQIGNNNGPARESRQKLPLIGIVTAFLIGLLSASGILYWWNDRDAANPNLSQEMRELATEPADSAELVNSGLSVTEQVSRLPAVIDGSEPSTTWLAQASDPVNTSPPFAAARLPMESHQVTSVQEDTLFPQRPINEALASVKEVMELEEQSENEIHQAAPNTNRQEELNAWTIPFPFSELEVQLQTLKNFLPLVMKCDGSLVITGHTCTLGSAENNYYVGLARAKSVRDKFITLGVSAQRLRVNSAGDEQPVATNDTKGGRQENRRAVIHCRME